MTIPNDLTRQNEALILRSLRDKSQVRIAEALGVSEATVSRLKDEDTPKFAKLLAELDLKVVNASTRTFDPQVVDALRVIARLHLDRSDIADWISDSNS
jgi:transcriptional regulator with XRE-family HTH domain